MSVAVKSRQAFFLAARTDHAVGLVPIPRHIPALSILAPNTRLAWPWGGGESDPGRRACVSVRAPSPNDRLSVWDPPRAQAPATVYASTVRHATNKSLPTA